MPASIAPFICKCSDAHSKPLRFFTQKELQLHVYNDHDLANLRAFYRGRKFYQCPWENCKNRCNDIPQLKEHLRKHTKQMPFKCPICDSSRRFRSFDKLERHLIFIHRERVLDFTDTDDMTGQEEGDTSEDENEDYLICKALFKRCDREYAERLIAQYGLEDFDL
ncbi:hypothetical protein RhiirA5_360238 [Rhizophagus irregularis]|uniref:C2H2-type domain-containing protein n=3 Tax=Rhizophagus irregularis TaxID=588596 RepID=A0A2I1FH76_9GLOM|nr:hypothetical protein RirG_229880 [Rhizophagus irregularis DAOM 197198w]PKC06458.1 hypothetical protein RhiirA5_360238 [Rhizophagus irregularis]PKC60906.1 hypothetical protein RhiirA1_425410 [Rhizophagus irregularis]PKY33688.1 hypothetical protein RhiirB3_420644 [Rhizophagus irregularis]PKY48819.1 hypothetical protein RhiirA4_404784 [Rhizophagus irregularis]